MYCKKLKNIVRHIDSAKSNISNEIASKFDVYIRDMVTVKGREKLNPIHFSLTMDIPENTALMFFVIGAKCGLFKARAYYSCDCEDQFEIYNLKQEVECDTCEQQIIPENNREKVFLVFSLLEPIEICDLFEEVEVYQADFFNDDALGKDNISLAKLDEVIGRKEATNLLKSQRDKTIDEYLES